MLKKFKVGIVGCGGIANGKHLPNLAKIPEVELVAFCDLIIERAEEAKAKYGTPDAKVYVDYKELLADKSIDVVHVCTPNREHAPVSIAALEAGKHVMCEKPMAKTAADAKAMLEAAKKSGKKLTIGYQNRQSTEMRYVKRMCDEGKLGEIYYAKANALRRRAVPTWGVFMNEEEQGGGPLIDIGTHALDLCLYMMNNYEVESVMGNCHYKLGKIPNSANEWGPWDPEKYTVEDSAFALVKMKNGATIQIESSWAINLRHCSEANCTLAGTKGGIDFQNGLHFNGEMYSSLFDQAITCSSSGSVAFYQGIDSDDASYVEQRQWYNALINGTDPCVLPEQAYTVSRILEAVYESYRTGKAVYFD